jgi:hypothetical protein
MCSLLLGTCPLDGLGVVRESPRLRWTSETLYGPLLHGDLIVETKLDLGDHSGGLGLKETQLFVSSSMETWATFVVGRTSGTNLVSLVLAYLYLLLFLAQACFGIVFDLTLGVNPND